MLYFDKADGYRSIAVVLLTLRSFAEFTRNWKAIPIRAMIFTVVESHGVHLILLMRPRMLRQ